MVHDTIETVFEAVKQDLGVTPPELSEDEGTLMGGGSSGEVEHAVGAAANVDGDGAPNLTPQSHLYAHLKPPEGLQFGRLPNLQFYFFVQKSGFSQRVKNRYFILQNQFLSTGHSVIL